MKGFIEIVAAGRPKSVLQWAVGLIGPTMPFRFAPGVEFVLRNTGKQDLECVATFTPDADAEYRKARERATDAGILISTAEIPGDTDDLNTDGWSTREVTRPLEVGETIKAGDIYKDGHGRWQEVQP